MDTDKMYELAKKWENIARKKLSCANFVNREERKRFLEHSAQCYFDCAEELRDCLETRNPDIADLRRRLARLEACHADALDKAVTDALMANTIRQKRCSCGAFHDWKFE